MTQQQTKKKPKIARAEVIKRKTNTKLTQMLIRWRFSGLRPWCGRWRCRSLRKIKKKKEKKEKVEKKKDKLGESSWVVGGGEGEGKKRH